MKCSLLAIFVAALSLAGCGVSNRSVSTPADIGITGNWQLSLSSSNAPSVVGATYGIYLTQTGSNVTGIIGMQQFYRMCVPPTGPDCAFPYGDIALELTGTIDADGNIVLNAVPYSGGIASFSITASTTDNDTFNGTYSITETIVSGTYSDHGTISGYVVPNINGTYAGTVKSYPTGLNLTMGLTTTLSQTSSPGSDGSLQVNGSATFTGSPCFGSTTVPQPGGLLGDELVVDFIPTGSPSTTIILSGTLSPDPQTMLVEYSVLGACGTDLGSGTLTRQ